MNKRNLAVTLLVVCMLVGTMAFAQTGSFRLGAGLVGLTDSEYADYKALGYELTGRVWFAQLPQLTINGSYSDLDWKSGGEKDVTMNDIAVFGEYRIYNETNYGFSATAGWFNRGYTPATPGAEKYTNNYLTLGGKGNYVLMDGLQAIAGVSYAFNDLFKKEGESKLAIVKGQVGAEYDFAQVPGLKAGAYFLYEKEASEAEDYTSYGFDLGASYAVNF